MILRNTMHPSGKCVTTKYRVFVMERLGFNLCHIHEIEALYSLSDVHSRMGVLTSQVRTEPARISGIAVVKFKSEGYRFLYNTLLNSDRLIGCLWSRDIE